MKKYKILCELVRKEQFGEEIAEEEKTTAVSILLDGRNNSEEIIRYKKRMRVNPIADCVYPNYYLPPHNEGKKLRLVQGYLPKTNILYANHYEAEILRFQPVDEIWINKLLEPLGEAFLSFGPGQAASQRGIPFSYLLMAFTDINNEKTRNLLMQKREWLVDILRRGWITGKLSNGKISEGDTYNLLGKYIIRNAVCTLPEYPKKEDYRIYVDDADERCYCEIP